MVKSPDFKSLKIHGTVERLTLRRRRNARREAKDTRRQQYKEENQDDLLSRAVDERS